MKVIIYELPVFQCATQPPDWELVTANW